MYYEEKIIDGVLHFKTLPNGSWRQMSLVALTHRVQILEGRIKSLENDVECLEE